MNQIPDGLERELAPRDGRWCRMQARRDDRNPQHGAATIIDIGVSVSMPQATHRNQRKAPSVEWMGRIRDRDLFGPSILRPNRGIKKWDRRRYVRRWTIQTLGLGVDHVMDRSPRLRISAKAPQASPDSPRFLMLTSRGTVRGTSTIEMDPIGEALVV